MKYLDDLIDKINETHLALFIASITGIALYFAYAYGDANIQEMSNRGLKLSTFMLWAVALFKYQGTRKLNLWDEIIINKNAALGLVMAALLLGGAGCLFL